MRDRVLSFSAFLTTAMQTKVVVLQPFSIKLFSFPVAELSLARTFIELSRLCLPKSLFHASNMMKAYICIIVSLTVSSVAALAVERLNERAVKLTDGRYSVHTSSIFSRTDASAQSISSTMHSCWSILKTSSTARVLPTTHA